jgi:uncharacterized protein (DUF1330 family)
MKWSIPALAVTFVAGVVAGAGTALNPVHPLHAAGSPPAYLVYEANVTDPDGYKNNFLKVIAPKLEKAGAKFLARGGMTKSYLGSPPENRLVIAQYNDINAANAFYQDAKSDFETLAPKYANGIRYYVVEGVTE